MPIAVHIAPGKMSKDDYARIMGELESTGAGAPEGRLYHAAYGGDDVRIFEVWESPEHFEAHRVDLVGVLQGAGIDAGTVEFHDVHAARPD
jgi:hypothetical protein